jgi:hypothetical protein
MVDKIKAARIGKKILGLWDDGYSGDKIAVMTGGVVTGRSILRYVLKHGRCTWDTRKDVVCEYCGKEFKKVRSVFRNSRKHFCCKEHYWAHLYNPEYIRSVHGSRVARRTVAECGYKPTYGEVVHHIDGDCNNNDPWNLMVFASQSDHSRWHKNGGPESGVKPVWP